MDILEKARAYDEAFERAKALYSKGAPDSLHLEEMFPELKENKDEKIRKALISMFKHYNIGKVGDVTCEEIIAWLEKQKDVPEAYQLGFTEGMRVKNQEWIRKQEASKCSDEHPNELPCYKQVINNLSKAMEE